MNCRGDRNHRRDHFRIGDRPLGCKHAPHRAADDRQEFPDAEMVDQKFLRPHHVLNRDDRKIHAVGFSRVGIDGTRPCRAGTPPENVAADDEVFLRVKRTSRADHLVPPAGLPVIFVVTARQMRVPCQRMFHKNGVACIRIQGPIGLITDVQIAQTPSAVQLQPGVGMEILRRHNADGRFCFWFRFFTHCNLPALRCVIWCLSILFHSG